MLLGSQFYLSVGELTTTSDGAAKDNSPCCTSLNSVRQKICTTCRSLLAQDSIHTQNTQSEFSLSELLGEWRQSLLKDVMELLRTPTNPPSPQPTTSTSNTLTGTRWAIERFRYKRRVWMVSGVTGGAVASPWDMFAPAAELLRTSSASDELFSPQKSQSLLDPTPQPVTLAMFPLATTTQVPTLTHEATQRSGERSLPSYQKPGPSHSLLPSSGGSSTVSLSTKHQHSGMKLHHSGSTTTHQLPVTEQQDQVEEEEDVVKRCRKVKKKSSVQTPEDNDITWEEENMQKNRSLPSWMFPGLGREAAANRRQLQQ
ncbi:uncharacterized protein LOC129854233 [Salvelinus fontinalis]|uniref:uncharacterized protein LOC129854233 n=1 Tax=Salvelinus fontinalis TaxID=8038 RepID=UPI002486C934|nr:uncharacterized protein LOC129854233 [Salvelinus fontinalis]XP_055777013.1 uncharacterized protein LOC129854233 [Salvelinus fontinalis]